jgi:hypothetical protein
MDPEIQLMGNKVPSTNTTMGFDAVADRVHSGGEW